MRRMLSAAVAASAVVAMSIVVAPGAQAATGDTANSSGQFLSGSLLTGDLSNVAGIDGAQATYTDGTSTPPADEESAGLDLTALNAVGVTLPSGVSLPLGDLLNLGAVNQYAWAGPDGVSRAASGAVSDNGIVDTTGGGSFPASASLDLTQLLGSTNLLSTASLNLQGVTGVAALDGAQGAPLDTTCTDLSSPDNCRDYNIAGATLNLQSPLVGQFTNTVNGAISTLDGSLQTLTNTLQTQIGNTLKTVLAPLGGTVTVNPSVTINTTSLDNALSSVLKQTVTSGGVTIDLSTGKVTVDLAKVIDLNNLPPNSTLLSSATLQAISGQISAAMSQVQTQLDNILNTALSNVNVQISGGASVNVPLVGTAGVNLNYNGSLQNLLSGTTPIGISTTGLASILQPVLGNLGPALAALMPPLMTTAQTAISTAGNTIDGAVTTLTNGLSSALTLVSNVADVTINAQDQNIDGAGTFTETAVRVDLLGSTAAELNLGKAVVGPNSVNQYTVTLAATDTPAGQATTVTGGGWPANTDVTLQMKDPDGNNVGDPITVTTDANGNIPDGTTMPVPADAPPGQYSVVGTDAGGETATAPFQVSDTTAPDAPVIQTPADGSTITDNTPTITGTAEPGSTVTVYMDGAQIGTTTADANGDWSLDTTDPLADGGHTVSATATDAAGNVSDPTSNDFTVDTTPDAAPTITDPTTGTTTTDNTPTISGTGVAGDSLTVTDGAGDTICTTTVAGDGTWSCTPDQPLADGTYTVTATQDDPAGNTSPESNPVTFTVDATAPDAPVITGPADGSTIGDSTPTITGTGEPGDTVTVTDQNGDTLCTAVVDANGAWSCDSTVTLPDGDHTITATQSDEAGNTSPASDPVTFTVDTTEDAPVITDPQSGTSTTDTTPTISGTGAPGDDVTVSDQDGNTLCTTTVAADGTWSCDSSALPEGPTTITATQTDPTGNTSPDSNSVIITVDTTAPDAPVITSPSDGSTLGDNTPTISGTGEPGDTVTVTDENGTTLCTATVDSSGNWTCESDVPLTDGDHTLTATQTDPAGNTSPESDPVDITIDTTAPAAPVITNPTDGSLTSDATPPISGTGEAGDTVTVTDENGNTVCTATVDANGDWACTPTTPFTDGDHTITATQTDPAGNTSPVSDPVTFTVDATAPDAPFIETPGDGSTIGDSTPPITGTGEPGDTVTVTDENGNTVCTATVQADGTWSCTPTTPFTDGDHTITATQTDPAGNTSPVSDPVTFTVDTVAPDAPVIDTPADGSSTNDNTPTISGTAEPGSTVTVSIDGTEIGTTTADADGNWTLDTTDPLADGSHTVSATATDDAGNTSDAASNDFTVDTVAPDAPVITGPADGSTVGDSTPTITGTGEPGDTVTVVDGAGDTVCIATVGADGTWSCDSGITFPDGDHTITATQEDPAGNISDPSDPVTFTVDTTAPDAPVIKTIDGQDATNPVSTNDNTPAIAGTGEAGDTVTVTDDNGNTVCTTTVQTDGSWSCSPTTALADGTYTVTASQTDNGGNTSPDSNSAIFTIDTVAPDAPVITSPTEGSTTRDTTPVITGTGEPGDTVTVSIDDTVVGTATVDANGNWSLTTTDPLADGEHTVTATQTDPAGNESPTSVPVTFTVDTTAPAAPVITAPDDGTTTRDTTPLIKGTGTPGDDLTVTDQDGNIICTTTVLADGSWNCSPSTALPDGTYTLTATQTDEAGNTSDPSNAVTITIDTEAPAAPDITGPTDGSTIGDSTPTITGTGEPGATVTVTDANGDTVCTATVDANGTWTCDSTITFTDGDHTITATQTDEAGNTSPASEPVTFTVDTTAQPAPVITSPKSGTTTDDNTPTITGTGTPGDTVTVYDNGEPIGTATVGDDGTWTVTPDNPLSDGDHTLTATQAVPGGAQSPESDPVIIDVDTKTPAAPKITSPADGSSTTDRTPTVTGTGEPGDTITVFIDGQKVGTTTVNSDGTWSLQLDAPLSYGDHTVAATQTDAAGHRSDRTRNEFTVTPSAPTITSPQDGDTTGSKPKVSGTGKPGSTIVVLVDGHKAATTTVNANGTWSVKLKHPLTCGDHELTAKEKVQARRMTARLVTSPKSDPVRITVGCGPTTTPTVATTPTTTPTTTPAGTLPNTGAPAGLAWLLALGLLCVGAGAQLVRRRRG